MYRGKITISTVALVLTLGITSVSQAQSNPTYTLSKQQLGRCLELGHFVDATLEMRRRGETLEAALIAVRSMQVDDIKKQAYLEVTKDVHFADIPSDPVLFEPFANGIFNYHVTRCVRRLQ